MVLVETFPDRIINDRDEIVACVRRWGYTTTDAILDPACQIFQIPGFDGLIGYRLELGYAIVFGDPVCAPEDKPFLAQAFQRYCQSQGYTVIYVIVTEDFAKWAVKHVCKMSIEFGELLSLDPHHSPMTNTGTKGSLVRRKVKRAIKEGVVVKEYLPQDTDSQLEHEIEQVGSSWLQARSGMQLHISHIRLFVDRQGKRLLYAQQGDKIVGVAVLNQLKSRSGWLLNRIMVTPEAPVGTHELLVISALDLLNEEGCRFMSCGSIPAERFGEVEGVNRVVAWAIRSIFKVLKKPLRLEGHGMFWGKFEPRVEKSYLLFAEKRISLRMIQALMRAFNFTIS